MLGVYYKYSFEHDSDIIVSSSLEKSVLPITLKAVTQCSIFLAGRRKRNLGVHAMQRVCETDSPDDTGDAPGVIKLNLILSVREPTNYR
jgi:hypothetical protein